MLNNYGIDDGQPDTGGAMVSPQMSRGAMSPNAAPNYADGGAIPEDDSIDGNSPNTDVVDYTNAMDVVKKALAFGRAQHGLPASRPQQAQDTQESAQNSPAIPDEQESSDNSDEEGTESYAEGGAIADDIEASNNATDDGPQYGVPEQVPVAENGEAPPISTNNVDQSQYPEQTALPDPRSEGQAPGAATAGIPNDIQPETPLPQGDTGQITRQAGLPEGDTGEMPAQPGAVQRIMAYLQRADAMNPAQAKAAEAQNARPDKNETTMATVQSLASQGDEQQAFNYLQYKAKRYEVQMAHAAAALNGTRERPPSLDVALQSANEAFTDLPDPTDVRFRKNENGVEAYIRPLGDMGKPQKVDMSIDQFKELVKPGGIAQWDKALAAGGAAGLMKQLAPTAPQGAAGTPEQPREQNEVRLITGDGSRPDRTFKNGVETTETAQDRALALIRAKNEGRGTPDDKIKVKNAEYDRRDALQAAKDKAAGERGTLTNAGKNERSTAGIGSREKIAANKLALAVKQLDATNDRSANANVVRALNGRVLATGGQNLNEPKDKALYDQITGGGNAPRAPSPQAPQAPQPTAPGGSAPTVVQSPADAMKLAPGTVYMTPDGRKFTR